MRIYGVAGWKNTGKTGLVVRLVAHFAAQGLRVATVKHAHKGFDIDQPGRDSFRHREAGAGEVIVASPVRVAHIRELGDAPEPGLADLLARLSPADLVLIEGYKREPHPKIETHRAEAGRPLLAQEDATIRAVASDSRHPGLEVPVFDLDDTAAIADFIAAETGLDGR